MGWLTVTWALLDHRGPPREAGKTAIEHTLAHVRGRRRPKARYKEERRNLLDLRQIARVENLHVLDIMQRAA